MKPSKFAYVNAKSLDEALLSLKQPESKIIAGGQSLVPLMNYRSVSYTHLTLPTILRV